MCRINFAQIEEKTEFENLKGVIGCIFRFLSDIFLISVI